MIQTSKDNLEAQMTPLRKSLDSLRQIKDSMYDDLSQFNINLVNNQSELERVKSKQNSLSESIKKDKNEVDTINSKLIDITKNELRKRTFYLTDSLIYTFDPDRNNTHSYAFKDMKTLDGLLLPKFEKTPYIVNVSGEMGLTFMIDKVTKDSIKLSDANFRATYRAQIYYLKFTLVIAEPR